MEFLRHCKFYILTHFMTLDDLFVSKFDSAQYLYG
jgi:hypothetical protein